MPKNIVCKDCGNVFPLNIGWRLGDYVPKRCRCCQIKFRIEEAQGKHPEEQKKWMDRLEIDMKIIQQQKELQKSEYIEQDKYKDDEGN